MDYKINSIIHYGCEVIRWCHSQILKYFTLFNLISQTRYYSNELFSRTSCILFSFIFIVNCLPVFQDGIQEIEWWILLWHVKSGWWDQCVEAQMIQLFHSTPSSYLTDVQGRTGMCSLLSLSVFYSLPVVELKQ